MKLNGYIFYIALMLLLFVALINYLIDPYGRYGTDLLDMNRIDDRTRIVNKILNNEDKNIILLGSSRSMGLDLKNSKFLNLALFAGSVEDYYCIIRYCIEKKNYPINTIVIGLEPDLMVSTHTTNSMLVKNPQLSVFLDMKEKKIKFKNFIEDNLFFREIKNLLSIDTLKDSLKLVVFFFQEKYLNDFKKESGLNQFRSSLNNIIKKKDSVAARILQYMSLYSGSVFIDEQRLDYLNKIGKYLKERGIQLKIFVPGYSKEFYSAMEKNSSFLRIQKEFDYEIISFKKKYNCNLLDFRPSNWRGEDLVFFDGVHPDKKTNKILSEKIKELIKVGF